MTQKYKQMSLLEDSLAKPSVKQDYKKADQTTDGSGMKCLMLLSKSDQDGLLGKMCKALLISKTAWFSDRCKMTWKVKVSKSNVSLFQLQVSVLGINEKESGYWLQTPTTQDARIGPNNIGGNQHRKKRGSIALADQVLFPQEEEMETIKMYPTPRAADTEGGIVEVKLKNGHFYRENKKGERWGVKLRDAVMYPSPKVSDKNPPHMKKNKQGIPHDIAKGNLRGVVQEMYPTPRARDYKDSVTTVPPSVQKGRNPSLGQKIAMKQMLPTPSASEHKARMQGNTQASNCITALAQKEKPGGRLNPEFVEFLMGYPMGWTEIEPKE